MPPLVFGAPPPEKPVWDRIKGGFKTRDFALMQSAIAENHTLKIGTHRPRAQSPKEVKLSTLTEGQAS